MNSNLSNNDLYSLLDFPNNSALSITNKHSYSRSYNANSSLYSNNRSELLILSQNELDQTPFNTRKIRTKMEETQVNASEMYMKILKSVKNATKTIMEENKANMSSNINQNLLEKIRFNSGVKIQTLSNTKDENNAEVNMQPNLKRKFTDAFSDDQQGPQNYSASTSSISALNSNFPPVKKFKSITIDNFFKK